MEMILDIIIDTAGDVLKILPFLFLTYLFLEWLETQTEHRFEAILERHHRLAPFYGSLLGLVPSCGLSGAAGSLFATGVIGAGTLASVYLSTSDEMIAIMVSAKASPKVFLPIMAVKFVIAVIFGYIGMAFARPRKIDIDAFCEREHDDHSHGIFYSALLHTFQITAWLLAITFIFNGLVELIGMDTLQNFVSSHKSSSVLVSTLVGMIPSCGSSIVLSRMYLDGVISFAAVTAGLCANAGTGMMILFRVNPDLKENISVILYVWASSLIAGFILQIFGL